MKLKFKGLLAIIAAFAAICTLIGSAIGLEDYISDGSEALVDAAISECDHHGAINAIGIELNKKGSRKVKNKLYLRSAEFHRRLGDYEHMSEMLEKVEIGQSKRAEAAKLLLLAAHNIEFGDLALAELKILKARHIYESVDDNVGASRADLSLSKVYSVRTGPSDYKTAYSLATNALATFRFENQALDAASALQMLALLEVMGGKKSDKALIEARLTEGLSLAEKEKDCYRYNSIRLTASYAKFMSSDVKEEYIDVINTLSELEKVFDKNSLTYSHAKAERFLGIVKSHISFESPNIGDPSSLKHFYEALEDFRTLNNKISEADTHRSLGNIFVKNDRMKALKHYRMALKLYEMKEDEYGIIQVKRKILELSAVTSGPEIITQFERLVEDGEGTWIKTELIQGLYELGKRLQESAQTDQELAKAKTVLQRAQSEAERGTNPEILYHINLELDRIYCLKAQYSKCLARLNKLKGDYEIAQNKIGLGNVFREIALQKAKNELYVKALESADQAIKLHLLEDDKSGLARDYIAKAGIFEDMKEIDLACAEYRTAVDYLTRETEYKIGLQEYISSNCSSSLTKGINSAPY